MQACLCPGKDQAGTVVANANGIVGSRDVDRLNISIGNEHRRSKSTHKPRARRPERGGGRQSDRNAKSGAPKVRRLAAHPTLSKRQFQQNLHKYFWIRNKNGNEHADAIS